jgi:hypothetical protein
LEIWAVTVVLRHNAAIDLNLVEYRDAVSFAELKGIAAFVSADPAHMKRDTLTIVCPAAHFSSVEMTELDALFEHYRALYAPLHFDLLRRSAWVCQSEAAAPHVAHWLGGDIRSGMRSTVREFDTIEQAGEWLVLNETEIAATVSGDGFAEIIRFTDTPVAPRAAAR